MCSTSRSCVSSMRAPVPRMCPPLWPCPPSSLLRVLRPCPILSSNAVAHGAPRDRIDQSLCPSRTDPTQLPTQRRPLTRRPCVLPVHVATHHGRQQILLVMHQRDQRARTGAEQQPPLVHARLRARTEDDPPCAPTLRHRLQLA